MKTFFKINVLLALASAWFVSCEKDEAKIYLQGGTPPVLTVVDASPLVLIRDNADQAAVTFEWTNPEYQFNTGVSSEDVTYTLEVDTVGAEFSSPNKQELSISRDLSVTYTVQQLNTILTKLNLQEDIPHQVEFRVTSTLVNNSAPLSSNTITLTITPYLDVAVPVPPTGELYITGSGVASDWTNSPPETQKCVKVSNTEYYIIQHFTSGKQYKFLSTLGQWQPQYGGSSKTGGNIGYNMGGGTDPDAIPTPDDEGDYKVDLNFKTGIYTVTKQ